MSATNAFETSLATLLFNNTALTNIGDAAGLLPSAAAGSFFVSLHTADPGETGTQTTSETAYTGYARLAIARSAAGWTVAANNVSNAAAVTYGVCTAAPGADITHFGIGTDVSGAGNLLFKGQLVDAATGLVPTPYTPAIGNAPSFAVGVLDVNVD